MVQAPLPRRPFFSFRVLLASCIFAVAVTTGVMTAFGPTLVLGPRRPERIASLQSAVHVGTGAPARVTLIPAGIGPGMIFETHLTIPGGIDGHAWVQAISFETDHPQWPARVYPLYGQQSWPAQFPKHAPTKPTRVTVGGLHVPLVPELAYQEVALLFTVAGIRPEWQGEYFRDAPFEELVEVRCKLGRGRVLPTGLGEIDLYNRTTTGIVSVLALLAVTRLLRRDTRKRQELPQLAPRRPAGPGGGLRTR